MVVKYSNKLVRRGNESAPSTSPSYHIYLLVPAYHPLHLRSIVHKKCQWLYKVDLCLDIIGQPIFIRLEGASDSKKFSYQFGCIIARIGIWAIRYYHRAPFSPRNRLI
ncbi:hypothetical protein ABW20_dc0109260 [Dactylellina cionopaga]|nr:hypothetical protein ABW20_dc0109260 [Dactylellina cionopaga]